MFKIRPQLDPVRETTERGDVIIGGAVGLQMRGPEGSVADVGVKAATLIFHAAYLDHARNARAEFQEFARRAGSVRVADGRAQFELTGNYEYSVATEDSPLLTLHYSPDHFAAGSVEAEGSLISLPAVPEQARFLELAIALEIEGTEEAALQVGDRLDVPLDTLVHVTEISAHFAPGEGACLEGDPAQPVPAEPCKIVYEVMDPFFQSLDARVEISSRKAPDTVLAKLMLTDDQRKTGKHELLWDGLCTEGEQAGKPVTALHSPYRVRVILETLSGPSAAVATTSLRICGVALRRAPLVDPDEPPAPGSEAHYQLRLTQLGFHTGPIDGQLGDKSKRAVKDFQVVFAGLTPTGQLDDYTKAYLDGVAPPGSGLDRYQFILNAIGFRCGNIDGLTPPTRALRIYRRERGLPPGDTLDDATKAMLDAEVLPTLEAREVFEGDTALGDPLAIPLPAEGTESKVYTYCDGSLCPGDLPYRQKFGVETKNLIRPHLALQAVPLLLRSDGTRVFSPHAVGEVQIAFRAGIEAPPPDLGIPDEVARTYAQARLTAQGDEVATGHHVHVKRGGVRSADDAGIFLAGTGLKPYSAEKGKLSYTVKCCTDEGPFLGTAGVYFVPSTIAGDRFSVVARVDDKGFDEPPLARAARTGVFVNWRRYSVSKLWFMQYVPNRPHRTEAEVQLGLVPWYQPAHVEFIVPKPASVLMIEPRGEDQNVIDLPLFTALLRETGYTPAQLTDAEIKTRFDAGILWPLQPAAQLGSDEEEYYYAVDSEIYAFEERFSTRLRELSRLEGPEGLMTLVFDENAPEAGTHGVSAMTNPDYQVWAWSILASKGALHLIHDQDTSSETAVDGETLAHEYGHALWLHHASTSQGEEPSSDDLSEHNPAEYQTCTMSYISLAKFCGKCILKLRGLDETKV